MVRIKLHHFENINIDQFIQISFHLGEKLKDIVHGVMTTQVIPAPDSRIKGRLLSPNEGCGFAKARFKKINNGSPAIKSIFIDLKQIELLINN